MYSGKQIICISGIDGSGKTSIIEELRKILESGGCKTRYIWLRYNHYLTKLLLVFCRLVGLTRYEYPDGVRVGYHDFYKSRVISWLFILLTYIDTLLVSIILVRFPGVFDRPRVVVCDRWVLDILIDLEIDTKINIQENSAVERMFRSLMPGDTMSFLVIRSKEAVLEARPENTRDGNFLRRWDLYDSYSRRSWVKVINNDAEITDAVRLLSSMIGGSGQ